MSLVFVLSPLHTERGPKSRRLEVARATKALAPMCSHVLPCAHSLTCAHMCSHLLTRFPVLTCSHVLTRSHVLTCAPICSLASLCSHSSMCSLTLKCSHVLPAHPLVNSLSHHYSMTNNSTVPYSLSLACPPGSHPALEWTVRGVPRHLVASQSQVRSVKASIRCPDRSA